MEVLFTPVLFRVRGNFVLEPLCLPNTSFVTHQRDATSVSERGLFTKVASFVTRKELGSRKPWETIPGQPSFRYKLHVHRPYSALFRLESNSIMKFFALLSRKMYRESGPALFSCGKDYFREGRGSIIMESWPCRKHCSIFNTLY